MMCPDAGLMKETDYRHRSLLRACWKRPPDSAA